MATSELLPATVALSLIMSTALRWTEGPHFYLPELDDVPSSLFRWFQGALTKPPLGLAFANTEVARQPYVFRTPDCVRRMLRNCNVRFMLRPASLFAPLRTGRLLPSLPPLDRSNRKSVMTTGTFASSLTGLSPAALATLWAALRVYPWPPCFMTSGLSKPNRSCREGGYPASLQDAQIPWTRDQPLRSWLKSNVAPRPLRL